MTVQDALNKAVEAGWRPTGNQFDGELPAVVTEQWIKSFCFLDPSFWQSLVNAILTDKGKELDRWIDNIVAHAKFQQFCEHIWQGKTADSFFETLN